MDAFSKGRVMEKKSHSAQYTYPITQLIARLIDGIVDYYNNRLLQPYIQALEFERIN